VTVSDPALVARAAEQITAAVGVQAQVDGEQISAPVQDPGLLPAVLRALDEAGIEVAELGLRGASLDDVFLALTGHSDRRESSESEDTA